MPDALALEADPYHARTLSERDHLLAAALYAGKRDAIPTTNALRRTVAALSSSNTHAQTTADVLVALAEDGLIERIDDEPVSQARGVRVTDAGYRVLDRGATRLDAARSIRGGENG